MSWFGGRRRRQRQCQHLRALGIYGDAIRYTGWKRGFCPDCGLWLDSLPDHLRSRP